MVEIYRIVNAEYPGKAHPDRFANTLVEKLVGYLVSQDPLSKADIDAIVGQSGSIPHVHISGNIATSGISRVQHEMRDIAYEITKSLAKEIGYNGKNGFDYDNFKVTLNLSRQSPELQQNSRRNHVGDSRVVYGYACNETPEYLPLVVIIAQKIADRLDESKDKIPYLRPDGKVQVSYNDLFGPRITIAAQHEPGIDQRRFYRDVVEHVVEPVIEDPDRAEIIIINGGGSFVNGGPRCDKGTSNIKLCAYGESIPHGGGGFWGKDATKPEVFGLLGARRLARHIVESGADEAWVALGYSIGNPIPLVYTYPKIHYDLDWVNPHKIIEDFGLRDASVIQILTSKKLIGNPDMPWER